MKIAVVGLWHLGEIYSACLAELGHTVVGISEDAAVVEGFKKNVPPLAEPRLAELIAKHQNAGHLAYTTNVAAAGRCDAVWITFDTPIDGRDRADTSVIFKSIAKLAPHLKNNVLLVVSSQLPVGTSAEILRFLKKKRRGLVFRYAYIPENLRLGEAVGSFLVPKRIVIGAADSRTVVAVQDIFKGITVTFLAMNVASAEMVKHALNSFLATSLSFSYDIADMCEYVGASSVEVTRALRADPRIGPGAYLDASLGFSGGTLGRDLDILLTEAKKRGISLPIIRAVLQKNIQRKNLAYRALEKHLKTLEGKKIAILGITYKAGTSTLRRSLALEIARGLHARGASLALCDPHADEAGARRVLSGIPFSFTNEPLAATNGCNAAIFITPWPSLRDIRFREIKKRMRAPFLLFDARNFFYDVAGKIQQTGMVYLGVGTAQTS